MEPTPSAPSRSSFRWRTEKWGIEGFCEICGQTIPLGNIKCGDLNCRMRIPHHPLPESTETLTHPKEWNLYPNEKGPVEEKQTLPYKPTGRDWIEDSAHENGNYQCFCPVCKLPFFGHKRRSTCKPCGTPIQSPAAPTDGEIRKAARKSAKKYLRFGLGSRRGCRILEGISESDAKELIEECADVMLEFHAAMQQEQQTK